MKRMTTVLAAAALLLAVSVPAVLAADGTRIGLRPAKAFPAAKGSAKFKVKGNEREFEAEVQHIRRLAGKRVVFYVAGKRLGTAKVSHLGAAHITRNSERSRLVPSVGAGTTVRVRTTGGILIASGSF
jgi:hypothetical protein